jgi:predicted RNA polymerase sigma factor
MAAATDWRQVLAEHDQFPALAPKPVATLNRAVGTPITVSAGSPGITGPAATSR